MDKLSIYNSLNSYLLTVKFFGLFPYFSESAKMSFKFFKFLRILHTILMLSIPLLLAGSSLRIRNIPLLHELWKIVSVIGSLLVFLQLLFQVTKRKSLQNILDKIENYDKISQSCGLFIDYKRETRHVRFWILSVFVYPFYGSLIVILAQITSNENVMLASNVTQNYQLLLEYFLVVQFTIFTSVIKNRLIELQKYLKSSLITSNFRAKCSNLHQFLVLFRLLCEIIKQLNNIFTSNLTLTLVIVLANKILSMYSFTIFMYKSMDIINIVDLLVNGGWLGVNVLLTMIICKSGHSLHVVSESLESTILDFIDFPRHENLLRELQSLHYRVKNTKKCVENVFITIDWKLLFMVRRAKY